MPAPYTTGYAHVGINVENVPHVLPAVRATSEQGGYTDNAGEAVVGKVEQENALRHYSIIYSSAYLGPEHVT